MRKMGAVQISFTVIIKPFFLLIWKRQSKWQFHTFLFIIRWKEESMGGSLLCCYGVQHSLLVLKCGIMGPGFFVLATCDSRLRNASACVCVVCVCVCSVWCQCVCVCVWERERETERESVLSVTCAARNDSSTQSVAQNERSWLVQQGTNAKKMIKRNERMVEQMQLMTCTHRHNKGHDVHTITHILKCSNCDMWRPLLCGSCTEQEC